jgi:alkylation response protein AidB-like acyl-CoA dehydrogenase
LPSPDGQRIAAARAFAEREVAPTVAARDRAASWDGALFRRMGSVGLLGAPLPPEHGGGGGSATQLAHVLEGFGAGSGDAGLALAWLSHTLLCALPIARLGTAVQKQHYLPSLASGDRVGCLAHHEPQAGDGADLLTRARRHGDRWVIEGAKSRVIGGAAGDLFLVTAVTDAAPRPGGISVFLVERGTPGLTVGPPDDPLGMRTAAISSLVLDGCDVPVSSLLATEGRGLVDVVRPAQRWERGLLLAPWLGLLRALLDRSVAGAREPGALGRPRAELQTVRLRLADMMIGLALCERMLRRAAWRLDHEAPSTEEEVGLAKVFAAEWAERIAHEALKLQASGALAADPLVERAYRDAGFLSALGGNNDVVRTMVARSLLRRAGGDGSAPEDVP